MFSSIDELLHAQGRDLGASRWHLISQAAVDAFADITRAHEWIHVDVGRARREGPFGSTVAHGYLTLSLATFFLTDLMGFEGPVGLNYGLDRVRFPAPVPVGSAVRAHGVLLAASHRDGGVQTKTRLTYETNAHDKPPCVADVLSLVLPGG